MVSQYFVGDLAPKGAGTLRRAKSASVEEVPIESSNTEKAVVEPSRESYEAERKEAKLIQNFIGWSRRADHEYTRFKIVPKGEAKPIFSDLYSKDSKQLIEAKGSVPREAIRMAIGQLYDYRRFAVANTHLGILLPELPRPDLLALIHTARVTVIHLDETDPTFNQAPGQHAFASVFHGLRILVLQSVRAAQFGWMSSLQATISAASRVTSATARGPAPGRPMSAL